MKKCLVPTMIMIILLSLLPFTSAYSTNSISNEFFASTTATVNLTIAGSGGFGTTTLTKGKSYTYTVKVKNNGSSSWLVPVARSLCQAPTRRQQREATR